MAIEQLNEPVFRITCDRCGAARDVHGSSFHGSSSCHAAVKAQRGEDGTLRAFPSTNSQEVLCDACADSYEAWWQAVGTPL